MKIDQKDSNSPQTTIGVRSGSRVEPVASQKMFRFFAKKNRKDGNPQYTGTGIPVNFTGPKTSSSDILSCHKAWPWTENELIHSSHRRFTTRDNGQGIRERNIQARLSNISTSCKQVEREGELSYFDVDMVALPTTYSPNAPQTSRRSMMSIGAKINGTVYPTLNAIDPYFRAPVVGEYIDDWKSDVESDEELPRGNQKPSRKAFKMKNGLTKPGTIPALANTYAPNEGRNILNMEESLRFSRENESKLVHLLIPMKKLETNMLIKITTELLLNTTGPFQLNRELSRPQIEQVIEKLLSCFGFNESAWVDGVRILTSVEDTMKSSYTITGGDDWSKLKEDFDNASGNIYKTPVFVDRSVIDRFWACEPQEEGELVARLPRPKRQIDNVTFYESDAKVSHQEEPTLESIEEGVKQLKNLAEQVLVARGESRKGVLLEEHDELANVLLERITRLQILTKVELDDIKQEKMFVKQKLDDSKRLISGYEEDITDMGVKLDALEAQKVELLRRISDIESQSNVISEDNKKLREQLTQNAVELDAKKKEAEEYMRLKEELKIKKQEESESMKNKLNQLSEKMEISLQVKEDLHEADIKLTDSVKKHRKDFGKLSLSPIAMGVHNQSYLSDTEEDSDTFGTPCKTINKGNTSHIAAMTLTPSKIGLKAWDDNIQNFSSWFSSMRMQIEAAKVIVDKEEAVIRLILMCLPSKYSWVTNAIADNADIKTVSQAKKEILNKIYGERGLLEDFVTLKMSNAEHPNSFLQRIKTDLEASEDLNSGFVLRMVEEKLTKNLDHTTNIEFQRLLKQVGRNNLTFKKLQEALESAVQLTESSNKGNLNQMGLEILNAMNNMQKKINKCYGCGGTDHFMNKCPELKGKFKKNTPKLKKGSQREQKTKKDGRKCYKCGKEGHIQRNCPN